jgi:hypothetical protein
MADYIPRADADFAEWLGNFKTKLSTYAITLGLPPGEVSIITTDIDAYLAKNAEAEAKRATAEAAIADRSTTRKTLSTLLRKRVKQMKASDNFTPAIGEDLQVIGEETPFDPNTYKPVLTASVQGGDVRIDFKKLGVEGLNIYCRKQGQVAWNKLGFDSVPPSVDTTPLAQPGVAEIREYMARDVVADVEIGLDSDIVTCGVWRMK